MIDPDADINALNEPVHAERVEHLLLCIACALTRAQPERIAYWQKSTTSLADFAKAFKR